MKTWSTAVIVALLSSFTIGTQMVEASPSRTASGSRGNGSSYEVWRMNRDRNNDLFELRVWRNVHRQTNPPTCTYTFVSRSDALAFWDNIADQAGCPNQATAVAPPSSNSTTQAQQPRPSSSPRRTISITTVSGETTRQPTTTTTANTTTTTRPTSTCPNRPTTTTTNTPPQPSPTGDIAGQILALVNAERQRAGVAPLTLNSQLNAAAQNHGRDMANNNHFSHTGTDGSSPGQRAVAVGYPSSYVGENIAWGQTGTGQVMRSWMESPGHRQNILNPNYTELGVAHVVSASGRPYWVQKFGRPR